MQRYARPLFVKFCKLISMQESGTGYFYIKYISIQKDFNNRRSSKNKSLIITQLFKHTYTKERIFIAAGSECVSLFLAKNVKAHSVFRYLRTLPVRLIT
ncbi:hypothetical protein RCL_jg24061.t1 [Rhizophagus clarus]|uniref:Uncharacterized protein n=1 Tax=Rhizophagus clarus TaxID=94130 RepID=A0A8H3LMW1_9GLOM|nr:hypothetical protein RCL_jg24061.t1 [Rhizophagus clarus]